MKIGFIGAGKVGFSLGKYLTERGLCVTGYYSRSLQSAKEAAAFTNTTAYDSMASLVADADALFLTVSDGSIPAVWEQLKQLPVQNKHILHCSGLLSSAVFSESEALSAFAYSIHPLLAVNDKYSAYTKLSTAFFALEGHPAHLQEWKALFESFGNTVGVLSAESKVRYHAAAAMASNLYVGLCALCEEMLCDCGFLPEEAHAALSPLIGGNAKNIAEAGPVAALTGPIERNDNATVAMHLQVLSKEEKEVYRALSRQVVKVAEKKHPDRDYTKIKGDLTS